MTYRELILRVAEDTSHTPREIRQLLHSLFRIIVETLMSGRDVELWQLGTIVNAPAAARPVMDPRTKTHVMRPATRRVKFVTAQKLRIKIKETQKLFAPVSLAERFGLKEKSDGKVCSGDRPGESRKGKEG